MVSEVERQGSCLCGTVRISLKTTHPSVAACHCSMCRKWGGGPALALEEVSEVQIEGADNVSVFSSSEWAERGFCKTCGTHIFYRLKEGGQYSIHAGLLDNDDDLVLDQQIFIDEKPSFYSFANKTKNMTGAEVYAMFAPPEEET